MCQHFPNRRLGGIVIAIDVSGGTVPKAAEGEPTAVEVIVQTSQIMQKAITRERMRANAPDVYIDVTLDQFNALEFHRAGEILEACQPVKAELKTRLSRILTAHTV